MDRRSRSLQAGDAAQPFIKNGVTHGFDAQRDIMFKSTNS
jgi:hypothetical protein